MQNKNSHKKESKTVVYRHESEYDGSKRLKSDAFKKQAKPTKTSQKK